MPGLRTRHALRLTATRRLVEVELPELLQQLLASCSPSSPWPQADSVDLLPALAHPCWEGTQQLIADVFEVLSLLCGVAVRACTRSADPLMVLLQLSSPKVMAACTTYMQQLWQAHEEAATASQQAEAEQLAGGGTAASHAFAGAVAAFSSCYSLLAAAVDAQQGLEQLESQLAGSLCSTGFLPAAVQLLLAATSAPGMKSSSDALQLHCQRAGWQLLTLALFLSGGDIAISPNSVEVRVGQHILAVCWQHGCGKRRLHQQRAWELQWQPQRPQVQPAQQPRKRQQECRCQQCRSSCWCPRFCSSCKSGCITQ